MKYLKRVKLPIICMLITLISFTVPGTAHSVAFKLKGTVQSVVFKQKGAKYIYSNNPEPVKPEMARTTGFFDHDYRATIVDTSVTKSVYLGGLDFNPGEYERAVNVLTGRTVGTGQA